MQMNQKRLSKSNQIFILKVNETQHEDVMKYELRIAHICKAKEP